MKIPTRIETIKTIFELLKIIQAHLMAGLRQKSLEICNHRLLKKYKE